MYSGDLFCMHCSDGVDQISEADVCQLEHETFGWERYKGDATGKESKKELVEAARANDLEVVRKMGVCRHVPREMCMRMTGRPPIKRRWVNTNKGDDLHPNYRSRRIAKEIRTNARPDLFTATPPLEYVK